MSLLGQGDEYQRVLARARELRLHHGLLIEGPRGTGKTSAAAEIAAALLCDSDDMAAPCGSCAACRKVASRQHADLEWLEVQEGKHDIAVEQVRQLQSSLGRSIMDGRARVIVVDPADRLTEQGQNALLKTLEEPGAGTHLLLCATRPENLLPTVRSRVARLRLRSLGRTELESELISRNCGHPEDRAVALEWAAGSLGLATALIDDGVTSLHQDLVGLVDHANDISAVSFTARALAGTSSRVEGERRVRLVLAGLRHICRERMFHALALAGGSSYFSTGFAQWAAIFEALFEAEADLGFRIGPDQVLTAAALQIQDAVLGRPATLVKPVQL